MGRSASRSRQSPRPERGRIVRKWSPRCGFRSGLACPICPPVRKNATPMPTIPTPKDPRYYRRGAWARFVEGLRYGGGIGQWSWLVHRVTGLGILLFLVIHVLDTFFVV